VAAAGVGCALAIALHFRARPMPVAAPPPVKHDPAAILETGRGQSLQWGKDGKEDWRVGFDSMTGYPNDRNKFTEAHFVDGKGERQFEIRAHYAETQGKSTRSAGPADIKLSGQVRITTSDHWLIQSDTATYSDATGVLTMPGPMTFARDRMTGEGQGATYDRVSGVLIIQNQAHVRETADEQGQGALEANASKMTVDRPKKSTVFEGATRLERDREILSADTQTLLLTDDEKGLRQLGMRGHASVVPKPGAADAPPDMRADVIDLSIYPDGRTLQHAALRGAANVQLASATGSKTIAAPSVDLQLAKDGQTVTQLNGTGGVTVHLPPTPDTPSARTITAPVLQSSGTEKAGLQSAVFTGGVVFEEHVAASGSTPASDRSATSSALSLKLNGDLGAVDEADFRQVVHFKDGDVTAHSDHATYAEGKNLLTLDAAGSKSPPEVVNGTVTVHGDLVKLATDTHDVLATGKVDTKSLPAPPAAGAKPATPGLFDGDQPVYGVGAELTYESGAQRATYRGSASERARVWQLNGSNNEVLGDTIVVVQASNDLQATGHVESTFQSDPKPAKSGAKSGAGNAGDSASAPASYHAKASELKYTDASRLAHYVGGSDPASLSGPNGTTTAKTIDVYLAQASRNVDRMVADGQVHLTSDVHREGKGDHLTYAASSDEYHLTGALAQAVLPQSSATTSQPQCMLYQARTLTFAGNGSAAASSDGDPVHSLSWPCGQPIK